MKSNPIQAAVEYGLDLSLTEENLLLTPQARLEQHQSALNLLTELERAAKMRPRGGSKRTSKDPDQK